ncbi:MAG: MBL fold metallo-hydrolase [Pseudobdellovibrionaceae bacterium]|nr:MBL fold metallo-hydrolase [Bdellovibrionales bacterium]USN47692.1 MAG: MBL fold metallo-hydrolase [Pseudobdellovibrionaceae bacterium]
MEIKSFFDEDTFTVTFVVFDPATKDAVIIDPVMDYDPHGSATSTKSVDEVTDFVKSKGLNLHYILETHAHADHLSGSQLLKERFPKAKVGIGANITKVQDLFKGIFNLGDGFATDGSQFDTLLTEDKDLVAGSIKIKTLFTPGHTPACSSYVIEDAVFTGDALFMPDFGTGRCDFPAGSAEDLYNSITNKLYTLPDSTRVFVGHDYAPGGRGYAWESTIGEEKEKNVQLPVSRSKQDFVKFRTDRDKQLSAPRLIFQSVQVNINAGHLPEPGPNGIAYLKMPLNVSG